MQDGMKNKQGRVETWASLNACKQSELNWSSAEGKVLKCDQFEQVTRKNVLHSVQTQNGATMARAAETDSAVNLV